MSEASVTSPSDDRSGFDAVVMNLDFGDYCEIEQKRYGVPNEFYQYKVIGRAKCNYYHPVPVDANGNHKAYGEMEDVVKVICCGVMETHVETFRVRDVKPCSRGKRFDS